MDWYQLSAVVNLVANVSLGALVFFKSVRDRSHVVFSLFCGSVAFWSFYYYLWQISDTASAALINCRGLMFGVIWIPTFFFHYTAVLVEKEKQHNKLLITSYIFSLIVCILDIMTPLIVSKVKIGSSIPSFLPVPGPIFHVQFAIFGFLVCYACVLLWRGIKVQKGQMQMQLKYSLVATVIGYGGGVTGFLFWYDINVKPMWNVMVSFYSFLITYSILKHRLMDITVIVRKTVIYSTVIGSLAFIYLATLAFLARLFGDWTGHQTVWSSTIVAALITFLFQPLRKQVQSFVDRKFFRQYVDREEKLYELSREVVTHTTPEAMSEAIMRVVGETLHPKSAVLYLRSSDGNGFTQVFGSTSAELPDRMPIDNVLSRYFIDHPQPFLRDNPTELGSSRSTRGAGRKKENL